MLISCYRFGTTARELAERFNISKSSVKRLLQYVSGTYGGEALAGNARDVLALQPTCSGHHVHISSLIGDGAGVGYTSAIVVSGQQPASRGGIVTLAAHKPELSGKQMLTAGEQVARRAEVRRYINQNRHRLRPLAEGRCTEDNRLLAAVYRLHDGFWLWRVGERLTREQVLREVLENAVMELETLAEHGEDSAELRELLADPEGRLGEVKHDTFPAEVDPLGDPLHAYHSLSLEQLRDRMPSGAFSSCGGCRRTYVADPAVLLWAAGQAIETRPRRPVTVLLARVVQVRPNEKLLEGPVFGVVPPHWQAIPWGMVSAGTVPPN
jgi:hypothetical protein